MSDYCLENRNLIRKYLIYIQPFTITMFIILVMSEIISATCLLDKGHINYTAIQY